MTIEQLRENKLISYEYLRGSHMYGLNIPTSDKDYGGVFVCPKEQLYGLRSNYIEQVSDKKSDIVFYELGRWFELLTTANPTVLESLFAPENCIIQITPEIDYIRSKRDLFLSKKCFNTFYGYAVSQIQKARGLNKKIVNPIVERKDILDFCYTFKDQGSQPIKDFLNSYGLDQRYCGLVNIPNMKDVYAVFYDFAAFFTFSDKERRYQDAFEWLVKRNSKVLENVEKRIANKEFYGYSGIVEPEEISKSNSIRLSSIPKGEIPVCYMTYNQDGYTVHCKKYKEYKEWEAKRNPIRYESNLGHNYDAKNIMHCMRLIRMAKELAQGKGFNIVRTVDRDYLLAIRNHDFEYEDIIEQLEKEKLEMEEAIKHSTLPENINFNEINSLLINIRNSIY